MGVPHRVWFPATWAAAAVQGNLLHADPALRVPTVYHHGRSLRPAIGVLQNPLEHGPVRRLHNDETPPPFHAATIGGWVSDLHEKPTGQGTDGAAGRVDQ